MVSDAYEGLLQELSKILNVPLHVDKNHSCKIKFKDGIVVQIELDKSRESLVIGTEIGEVPPGKYRENLFKEALRANGMPDPRNGTLAYSKQANKLVLFEIMPLKDLSGEKISTFLTPFMAKAKVWKEALSRGEVPIIQSTATGKGSPGIGLFGLRP